MKPVDISNLKGPPDEVSFYVFQKQEFHSIEGPLYSSLITKLPRYWLYSMHIQTEKCYYSHPEVKKYMLFKAIKELK
jgi:hypothetical protein